jgi:hypothetical protein
VLHNAQRLLRHLRQLRLQKKDFARGAGMQ